MTDVTLRTIVEQLPSLPDWKHLIGRPVIYLVQGSLGGVEAIVHGPVICLEESTVFETSE